MPSPQTRPFKFDELRHAGHLFNPNWLLVDQIRTEALRPAAGTFRVNMDRVTAIPRFLAHYTLITAIANRAAGDVSMVTGIPEKDAILAADDLGGDRWREAMDRLIGSCDPASRWVMGADWMDEFLSNTTGNIGFDQTIRTGITAIYYAMALNAYAAFEALAMDAWVAAVNVRPELCKQIKGKGEEKSVTFKQLGDFEFNVKHRMGDLLRSAEKVSFLNLASTTDAYEYTFGDCPVFKNNPGIVKAEQVRHLIAHRGGKIDKQFRRKAKGWGEYGELVEGEYLFLDGNLVSWLIENSLHAGVDLIEFLDQRLAPQNGPPTNQPATEGPSV